MPNDHQKQTIAKYRIERILGQGSMGVVYKGHDPDINRPVAIKTIRESLLAGTMGAELLRRFHTEAQAAGKLLHPAVVAIYEFGQDQGMPYFVMEYVEGEDLKSLLSAQRFTVSEAVDIVSGILDGLAYVHQLGVVHRDIKPANIFITSDKNVKIADFGIARIADSDQTQMGNVLGTPAYMSPEQCLGNPVDARSDVFSTGVVLYQMLSGQKPFVGHQAHQIIHQVTQTTPTPVSALVRDLPPALDDVVSKALAKRPEARYQTAQAFRDALLAASTATEVEPQHSATVEPAAKRSGYLGVALVSATILAAAIGSTYWLNEESRDKQDKGVTGKVPVTSSHSNAHSNARVQRLLKTAEAHFMAGRLVSPQGSNAYDAFNMILAEYPTHRAATEGVVRVKRRFFKRANLLIQADLNGAVEHLELARRLFPDDPATQSLAEGIQIRQANL